MMYLHETKLAMLIDADAAPVSHRRPYGDIDIRYPWKSDDQRAAEAAIVPEKKVALEIINQALLPAKRFSNFGLGQGLYSLHCLARLNNSIVAREKRS